MHTLCLLESVSRADGGIFEAESGLQRELVAGQGIRVEVVGLEDPYTKEDRSKWHPIMPKSIRVKGPAALGYSPDLLPALDPKADLLYAATLWKYPSWAALKWAERTGKPLIVAPHGSLDPWALRNAAWKKRVASALFKDRQLRKATCLRALTESEAESFRKYGLKNPIAVIPNGVNLPDLSESMTEVKKSKANRTLLFLGRIHPKKGLVNLLRAFKKTLGARPSGDVSAGWQLIIAGWDQGGHERELKSLCDELGLSWSDRLAESRPPDFGIHPSVLFFGPAFGDEKKALLGTADAFVLPSLSEGLPMSVLEAWAHGLPVVMTPECNLQEGFATEAAIRIDAAVEPLARGLDSLFSMGSGDLQSMGLRGYEIVKDRFTWQGVARRMREVYDWVLGGEIVPCCVRKN